MRERGVETIDDRVRRQHGRQVEVRDLPQRVDARVGPSGSVGLEPRDAEAFAHRPVQLALDGARVLLDLPAAVAGAGVFEGEFESGHVRKLTTQNWNSNTVALQSGTVWSAAPGSDVVELSSCERSYSC